MANYVVSSRDIIYEGIIWRAEGVYGLGDEFTIGRKKSAVLCIVFFVTKG